MNNSISIYPQPPAMPAARSHGWNRAVSLTPTLLRTWRQRRRQPTVVFHLRLPMNLAVCRELIMRLQREQRVRLIVALHCDSAEVRASLIDAVREIAGGIQCVDVDHLYAVRFDLIVSPVWELGFHHLPTLRRIQWLRSLLGLGRFRAVQMFHGLADKRGAGSGDAALLAPFDRFFLLNRMAYDAYKRLGVSPDRLHLVGFCKLDPLARGQVDPQPLLERIGRPAAPIVLYAPTWEFVNDDIGMLEAVVERLSSCPGTVVVKLHDLTWKHYRASGAIERLIALHPHVVFLRDADSSQCLAAADVMVSDMSSIAFEYLVLDRPVVFIETPAMVERFGTEGIEYRMRWCGDVVRSLDELAPTVRACIAQPRAKAADRAAVRDQLLFQPGAAVERAASSLYELLGMAS